MRHILLALIFVFAAFPLPAEAQSPPIDWEIGWETETDPEIMELNGKDSRLKSINGIGSSGDMTFSLTLEFWVDNPRPLPVEIDFDYSILACQGCGDFDVDIPDASTINGQSNESFSIVISGDGFYSEDTGGYNYQWLVWSGEIHEFVLTASELVAGQATPTEAKEIEKDLQFSKYNAYRLYTYDIPQITVYSGSDESMQLQIDNYGNGADTIIDTEVEINSCPQLVIEGLEGVVGKSVSWLDETLTVTAPQSHPEKECEVVFKVRSEGSGLWYSNHEKYTVYVMGEQPEDETSDDTSSSEQESMSNDLEVSDSGILPSLTMLSTLSMVGFAAILGREKR
tara:strand:- start:102 stop:1121 length:1020 start_codon:yes stop_codon:yes gene_type:complete